MKKLPTMMAVAALGLSFVCAQPAAAAELPAATPTIQQSVQRSIYTAHTTLTYSNNVKLYVTYTVNDTYSTITGVMSIQNRTANSRVSNVSWNYQYGLSSGSIVVTVTYYYNGSWHSEARTIYA